MKQEHLTFAQLVEVMHGITKYNEFYVQRDTMLDIAKLYKNYQILPSDGFKRPWYISNESTYLGYRKPVQFNAIARYEIVYSPKDNDVFGEWSIEQVEI